ncbi:hypothetical protein [Halomonas sp. M20]|uniref:hypothetical protein n=1 Tax=Halomonas sp. M20 TaxID=2763264 RepID=UPI001D0B28FE|nr:hypothetical protein [Halomonas sp. M20]
MTRLKKHRRHPIASVMLAPLAGGMLLAAAAAHGQSLIGPQPYDFPARSGQAALILYEGKKTASHSGSGGETTVYSNTTISATNWQQVEMTLGDDAEATMVTDSSQTSDGGTANADSEFFNTLANSLAE